MPSIAEIQGADALNAAQARGLVTQLRASAAYQAAPENFSDIADRIKARIGRKTPITGATNASPIVITATNHGFAADDTVTVAGILGNVAANGVWLAASITANTLALDGSVGGGAYTSGGTICDYISQGLSAISAALDAMGDHTYEIKGGLDALHMSVVNDREYLLRQALDLLYAEGEGANASRTWTTVHAENQPRW